MSNALTDHINRPEDLTTPRGLRSAGTLPSQTPLCLSMSSADTKDIMSAGANGVGPESTPSSRSQSISLQAAATMNAGLQRRKCSGWIPWVPTAGTPHDLRPSSCLTRAPVSGSHPADSPPSGSSNSSVSRHPHSPAGRRRSTVLMNLQLNDPGLPAPGELQEGTHHRTTSPQPLSRSPVLTGRDPHHNRTPSLGELHQELEAEQEAQVNRLLQMIRQQQLELQRLQAGQHTSGSAAEDITTPTSERSSSVHIGSAHPTSGAGQQQYSTSIPRSPVLAHPRGSFDMNRPAELRNPSRTPSRQTSSPRMRAGSMSGDTAEPWLLGGRDESAFYQAETQSLMRENQMLRHRIRELGTSRQTPMQKAPANLTCRTTAQRCPCRIDGHARTRPAFSPHALAVGARGEDPPGGADHFPSRCPEG